MAEGLLRALAGDQYEVFSAGTQPKGRILPEVQQVMQEAGIDISNQWSKSVTEYLGKAVFAYVITLCSDAEENCPAIFLNMGIHAHWPFDDPAESSGEERLTRSRRVRDQVEERLRLWLAEQGNAPQDHRQM